MPHRNFRAADGHVWEVWEVIPGGWRDQERRRAADRRSANPIIAPKIERRSGKDRRSPSPLVHGELAGGWLAFESRGEKRRLAPVPPDWESFSDSQLEELRQSAVVAAKIQLI